ncbi:MAG: carboxypeptidase-like regulatory domain-containing protein, partial [Bacteroidota bacterium]
MSSVQQIVFNYISLALCLLGLQSVAAQPTCTLVLSGIISDADTREPLGYATVELQGKNKRITADSTGKYVLTGLCAGDYVLVISHFSCTPMFYKVKVTQNTVLNSVLPHTVNELSEVRIVEKYDTKPAAISQQITADELRMKSGLSLAEHLQSVSG